jgi:uncharacterized lipoprotein YehR (DUF1307 family)
MEPAKNYKTLSELEDKYFGKPGTPEREEYETELSMEILDVQHPQISPCDKSQSESQDRN